MTSSSDTQEEDASAHLDELADGCGCAEVWEYLSERRDDEE